MKTETWGKAADGTPEKPKGSPSTDAGNRVEVSMNDIYYYSDICNEKILDMNRGLRDLSAKNMVYAINNGVDPAHINLRILSYGGSVFAGMAGMDAILETKKKVPVNTIVEGCAASAGTFLSVVGSKRYIRSNACMLIHQLSSGIWGKYAEIKEHNENMDRMMEQIKSVYKQYTNVPMKELDGILKRDIWWDAPKCLKMGLVDAII